MENFDAETEKIKPGETFEVATDYTQGDTAAEDYVITLSGEEEVKNFIIKYSDGTLSVAEREITLVIDDVNVQYGEQGYLSLSVYEGNVCEWDKDQGNETGRFLKYLAVYDSLGKVNRIDNNGIVLATQHQGTYYIFGTDTDPDYAIEFTGKTVGNEYGLYVIGQASLAIKVNSPTDYTYNGEGKIYSAEVDAEKHPDIVADFTIKYYYDIGEGDEHIKGEEIEGAPVNAGKYIVTIKEKSGNYSVSTAELNFSITPAGITGVTIDKIRSNTYMTVAITLTRSPTERQPL